jgi:hypothetical protein
MQLFIVFHKKIFDNNYKHISDDELEKNFTFIAVNQKIEKDYSKNKRKYNIINEWELPIYDPTFQERGYNENSAIYHVYANKLHERYKYIGFFQYDMILENNIIHFLRENIENIETGKTKPKHYLEESYNYNINHKNKLFLEHTKTEQAITENPKIEPNIISPQLNKQLTQKQLKFLQLEQKANKDQKVKEEIERQKVLALMNKPLPEKIVKEKSQAQLEMIELQNQVKEMYMEMKNSIYSSETKSNMTNTYFYFENFDYTFSVYECWREMPTVEFIIKDFVQYFKIPFDKTKIFPLYNCYVITSDLYNKIMPWIVQLHPKLYPWAAQPPNSTAFPHMGFIYERVMGFVIGQLCEYSIRMNISHTLQLKRLAY